MIDIDKERAAFSEWAKSENFNTNWHSVAKFFTSTDTQVRWKVWQAARATPLAPTPAAAAGRPVVFWDKAVGGFYIAGSQIPDAVKARAEPLYAATLPRQAAVQNKAEPTSIDIAKRMYGKWTDEQGIHCNRFPAFSELSTADQQKWIVKARASAEADNSRVA